ncbi:hypothetical protein HELRODRAFT_177803 [Helobdella robusta]|uniref:Anaphase-promoting complex subunit 4-like WD40 domain-containing protein n=1 Tax=Helobdella robusta TaxID=6412 RepID=T1FCA5_HELRO|nr:hypothetical protein HELRODRAFT_177803 [Helobdella robusta]ESN97743.1 hypothetical protein HELRODRAFT_177803 [Helobdella robusta]
MSAPAVYKLHHVEFFDFTPKPINCMAFDCKTKRLAVSRFDAKSSYIEIWNSNENWLLERILPSTSLIECMVWYKNRLLIGGLNGSLVHVDLKTSSMKEPQSSNHGAIWCMAVNPNEKLIAAGTEGGCVVLFEAIEDDVVYKKAIVRQEGRILSICWHLELNVLLTGSSDVRVYNAETGSLLQRISVASSSNILVWALAVTKEFTIISGDSSGQTAFWYGVPGKLSHSVGGITMFKLSSPKPSSSTTTSSTSSSTTTTSSSTSSSTTSSSSPSWVMAGKVYHSNDVRSLQFVRNYTLVSAGLDCQLIVRDNLEKKITKIPCTQQRKLVHSCRSSNSLLFQYDMKVDLWRLGSVDPQDLRVLLDSDKPLFTSTPSTHLAIGGSSVVAFLSKFNVVTFLDLCKVKEEFSSVQDFKFNSSNRHLAVACVKFGVYVIDILHQLPWNERSCINLDYHPANPHLILLTYSDGRISEFDVSLGSLTPISKSWNKKHHQNFVDHLNKKLKSSSISRFFYDITSYDGDGGSSGSRIVGQHTSGFSVIQWGKLVDGKKAVSWDLFKFYNTHNLHLVDVMNDNSLVLVEKTDIDLIMQYAPPLKRPKLFGV